MELERIYESQEGQEIYRRRKMRVEHPFGHIKRNLGVGAFLLRGLEGVNAENQYVRNLLQHSQNDKHSGRS
jgi:hypothetical protein